MPAEKLPDPPPPETSPPQPGSEPAIVTPPLQVPPPPKAAPRKKRAARTRVVAPVTPVAAPAPVVVAETPEPAPKPSLGQIFSENDQRRYNQEIDRDLQSARGDLAAAQGRTLTDSQRETVKQIESFIAQSEHIRKSDLAEASSLAHKAAVLSKELADALR